MAFQSYLRRFRSVGAVVTAAAVSILLTAVTGCTADSMRQYGGLRTDIPRHEVSKRRDVPPDRHERLERQTPPGYDRRPGYDGDRSDYDDPSDYDDRSDYDDGSEYEDAYDDQDTYDDEDAPDQNDRVAQNSPRDWNNPERRSDRPYPVDRPAPVGRSDSMSREFVDAHNRWRAAEGARALTWSNRLADFAADWAEQLAARPDCPLEHREPNPYGENLAWFSGMQSRPRDVVDMWGEEIEDYNHSSGRCRAGKVCGHYTQVVDDRSREVGCARAECGDGQEVWVCNYNPPGNVVYVNE